MGTGRLRSLVDLLMVVAILLGGFGVPAAAQEEVEPGATPAATVDAPVVTPIVTVEPTVEPTEPATEAPLVTEAPATETPMPSAPARVAPQVVAESLNITVEVSDPAARIGDAVTYSITAWGTSSAPEVFVTNDVSFQLGDIRDVTCTVVTGTAPATPCAWFFDLTVSGRVTPDAAVGAFRIVVTYVATVTSSVNRLIDNHACVYVALGVPACDTATITTPWEEFASVTINATMPGGAPFPDSGQICVWEPVNGGQCAQGQSTATFTVGSARFEYSVTAPGYAMVHAFLEIAEGDATTIAVALAAQIFNITKTVSDSNPAPGAEITFTVHAWGINPNGFVTVEDNLPWHMTNVSVSCTFDAGSLDWPESCEDWSGGRGGFLGAIATEADGAFDVTIVVTATVPDQPDWLAFNSACVFESGGPTAARNVSDPIVGDHCASVSILTQGGTTDASVTVNVTTSDGSPIPAETTICIDSPYNPMPSCNDPGAPSATFPVAAGELIYTVLAAGYAPVERSFAVEPGEHKIFEVVLQPGAGADMHITKTVSDPNPEPGAQVSYEIHVWGTTPFFEHVRILDLLPGELSDVRVSCDVTIGLVGYGYGTCAAPVDGLIMGRIFPELGEEYEPTPYDAVITVTGTVPDEQGVTFINLACAVSEVGGRPDRPDGRAGEQAFVQQFPQRNLPGGCAAATVMTSGEPQSLTRAPAPTGPAVLTELPSETPTATATPDGTPVVSILPKTGAAPGQGASSLGLIALIAAMSLGAGAFAVRGTRPRR